MYAECTDENTMVLVQVQVFCCQMQRKTKRLGTEILMTLMSCCIGVMDLSRDVSLIKFELITFDTGHVLLQVKQTNASVGLSFSNLLLCFVHLRKAVSIKPLSGSMALMLTCSTTYPIDGSNRNVQNKHRSTKNKVTQPRGR